MKNKNNKNIIILKKIYKKCNCCRRYKTLSHFRKSKHSDDGRANCCKECNIQRYKKSHDDTYVKPGRKHFIMSETQKRKISKKLTGRKLTEEHKRKIGKKLMKNQNRRIHYENIIDELLQTYVTSYKTENLGRWIMKNRKKLEKIKTLESYSKFQFVSFNDCLNYKEITSNYF